MLFNPCNPCCSKHDPCDSLNPKSNADFYLNLLGNLVFSCIDSPCNFVGGATTSLDYIVLERKLQEVRPGEDPRFVDLTQYFLTDGVVPLSGCLDSKCWQMYFILPTNQGFRFGEYDVANDFRAFGAVTGTQLTFDCNQHSFPFPFDDSTFQFAPSYQFVKYQQPAGTGPIKYVVTRSVPSGLCVWLGIIVSCRILP